ncbi:MAG: hypothetical protein AAFX99_05900 [Myxococcota bacterium]
MACSERGGVSAPASSNTPIPKHADDSETSPPDTSWLSQESCQPCHALGLPLREPWDAVSIYPDLYGLAPLDNTRPDWVARGVSDRLPIDTTVPEWTVYTTVHKGQDASKSCLDCHQAETSGRLPAHAWTPGPLKGVTVDPRMTTLHRWLHTPEDALENTFGLWLNMSTYRTLLVLNIKVLNYGAGHRAPSAPGSHVMLLVDAVSHDGQPLSLHSGYTLPDEMGRRYRGQVGTVYGRFFSKGGGQTLLERSEGATGVALDSRLHAGEHDELNFVFLLPEDAVDGKVAWTAKARLVWRSGLSDNEQGRVLEEVRKESP